MAERKISFRIEALGTDKTSQEIIELEKQMVKLSARRKEATKDAKEGRLTEEQLAKELAKVKIESAQVSKEQQKLKKAFLDGKQAANAVEGSYNQLVKETNILRQRLKDLPNGFDATNKEAAELKKQIADNTSQLKEFDKEIGDNYRSVGNYTEAIKDAFNNTGLFANELATIRAIQESLGKFIQANTAALKSNTATTKTNTTATKVNTIATQESTVATSASAVATKALTAATNGLSKGMKILKVAIAATGVGALVIAVTSLITAFSNTQSGADKLSKAFAFLQGGIDAVIGTVGKLGNALLKVFSGDFSGAAKEATEAVTGFGDAVQQSANSALALEELRQSMRDLNREVSSNLAVLQGQQEILRQISEDDTRSFKERSKAYEELAVNTEKLAAEELKRAKANAQAAEMELKNAEAQGILTDELKNAQVEAANAVIEAENRLEVTRLSNQELRNKAKRDEFEQDLDYLIDGFDSQKTVNEKIIQSDQTTFEEKQRLLNETNDLFDSTFNQQIGIIQQNTKEQIDANDLINESDAAVLNEKVKRLELDEKLSNRLLEIIRERRAGIIDLAELEAEINTTQKEKEIEEAELKAEQELNNRLAKVELMKLEAGEDQALLKQALLAERKIALENTELTENQKQLIIAKSQKQIEALDQASNRRRIQAQSQLASAQLSIAGSVADAIAGLSEEGSRGAKAAFVLSKGIALAEVAINLQKELALINANPAVNADVSQALRTSLIAAAIARGIGIAGTIKAAKFAKGGLTEGGMFEGPSHANGGVKFAAGGRIMEAEGGEAIINKKSTSMFKPILSAINQAGGGKKFETGGVIPKFQSGGLTAPAASNFLSGPSAGATGGSTVNLQSQFDQIVSAVQNIKVTNVVTETDAQIQTVNNIQSEGTL